MMSTASGSTRLSASNPLVVLLGLSGLLMLGSLGCRSSRDNQIDLLERELRTQEDYIYELEDYVLEYSEKLREVRSVQPHEVVIPSQPQEPDLEPLREPASPPIEEPSDQFPDLEEPEPEPDEPHELHPEELSPEELEIPELDLEEVEPVSQLEVFRDDSQVEAAFSRDYQSEEDFESDEELIFFEDDAVELSSSEEVSLEDELPNDESDSEAEFLEQLFEDEAPELGNRRAERLVIVGVYRGDEREESPTSLLTVPTSLLTVIEARDTNEEPVDLDGKISLMIMTADPVSPQRLQRWDFSAEETASAWQSSQLGDGLHLELPLEDSMESEEPLELWVRLVGADGRKLLAQLPLPWEQLISVEEAMDSQQIPSDDDSQLVEEIAHPLPYQELAELPLAEQRSLAEQEPAPAEIKEAGKADPRWRASQQQTPRKMGEYASTARGWISQPAGGREPRAATIRQSSTTVRQAGAAPADKKSAWTAGRNSRNPAALPNTNPARATRPQWAPPKSLR